MASVDPRRVSVRFFAPEDLDAYCDYFYRSPEGFIESIGLSREGLADEAESAVMHAYFIRPDRRGSGIDTISYTKACDLFLTEFGFKEVLFKTPIQNKAPMRIKETLGLKPIADETLDSPALVGPLPAKVFKIDRPTLEEIKCRFDI